MILFYNKLVFLLMYEVFTKAMCRPRLEIIICLSEFKKRRPLTFFLQRQHIDFALEVIIHLSEFKKCRPPLFYEGNA